MSSALSKDMEVITQVKNLWHDFKITVNDLQQPSMQLILNFVKRSINELGFNSRIFENKNDQIKDVIYCYNFINYCANMSGFELDLSLDSIMEPKRKQTQAIFGYLLFYMLTEKEKRSEREKLQKKVDDVVLDFNKLQIQFEDLKKRKVDQKQFILDTEKGLIELEAKKQQTLQDIEPLKKSIDQLNQRNKKLVDDLHNESEYNSQILKEKSLLQDKIQMKFDEIVDEKFYTISEKNRDETRQNIEIIDHDLNEILANLEQKRNILKHYEENVISFQKLLENFNSLFEHIEKNSMHNNSLNDDRKFLNDLKEMEKSIQDEIEKKLEILSEYQLNFDERQRDFNSKNDLIIKQTQNIIQEIDSLQQKIKSFIVKIIEKVLYVRLMDSESFLKKYSDDDLSRILDSILSNNSDFDSFCSNQFLNDIFQSCDRFLCRLINEINDETREVSCIHREMEMLEYSCCKQSQKKMAIYSKIINSLNLSTE